MEKLHHPLWITHAVNAVFGPIAAAILRALGKDVPAEPIPDYLAMLIVITLALTVACLLVRSRLSVENPGGLQIAIEDFVAGFQNLLKDFIGPKGPQYLPLVASIFLIIWLSNLSGLVPGLMAPTSNLNVTLGCALTVWSYYHWQGIREQGPLNYLMHFGHVPPGTPLVMKLFMAPLIFFIELIGHTARVMSLSLRLFGNVFGEELVIIILASLVPFIVPLPMMFLGLLTGTLQALIFAILTMVYLGGAVAVEHHDEAHPH
jgi:F-type H+-transporting ATPase subunit a